MSLPKRKYPSGDAGRPGPRTTTSARNAPSRYYANPSNRQPPGAQRNLPQTSMARTNEGPSLPDLSRVPPRKPVAVSITGSDAVKQVPNFSNRTRKPSPLGTPRTSNTSVNSSGSVVPTSVSRGPSSQVVSTDLSWFDFQPQQTRPQEPPIPSSQQPCKPSQITRPTAPGLTSLGPSRSLGPSHYYVNAVVRQQRLPTAAKAGHFIRSLGRKRLGNPIVASGDLHVKGRAIPVSFTLPKILAGDLIVEQSQVQLRVRANYVEYLASLTRGLAGTQAYSLDHYPDGFLKEERVDTSPATIVQTRKRIWLDASRTRTLLPEKTVEGERLEIIGIKLPALPNTL